MQDYSESEKKDIKERCEKAEKLLQQLQLEPKAQIGAGNAGDDVFGIKVQVYLQDLKYDKSNKKAE